MKCGGVGVWVMGGRGVGVELGGDILEEEIVCVNFRSLDIVRRVCI